MKKQLILGLGLISISILAITGFFAEPSGKLVIEKGNSIALIGGNLGSRMLNYGYFDTELHLRFPDKNLLIRNMCDGGDTPGFRPHSARNDAWAFPGAERFQTEYANPSDSKGSHPKPDEWLKKFKTDIILGFFGYSESFQGPEGLDRFKAELEAFIQHTKAQKYNGKSSPQLALISPIAFQDLSKKRDLPNGVKENKNLEMYTLAIQALAKKHQVVFLDAFHPSLKWYATGEELTIDGMQLNAKGYAKMVDLLLHLFEKKPVAIPEKRAEILQAVMDKDWYWHNDYKIPNGVHVYGRRYNPFGPDNYPDELIKISQMTANRDTMIWAIAQGKSYDLAKADAKTHPLKPVQTNFKQGENIPYLSGAEALKRFTVAPGFKIELFASEEDFPELAKPSQIAFDNKGRLWVATMPTYPHFRPGDPKPNDKIIILEDTNGDGKADKSTVFADHLHIPAGFELSPEGVFVSQGTNLKLLKDTNGDDRVDEVEIILSGFDDHDTHHVISAFCADPSGAIYMGEGVFLHTNVETPYGTVRTTHGGFMRYSPQRRKLERISQTTVPNPWGIAFNDMGQVFVAATSGPEVYWLTPATQKHIYGIYSPLVKNLIEDKHKVRPTSGLEFIHSRHFPEELQGHFLINNTIGFLGTKVHGLVDDGTGFQAKFSMDLIKSSDPNFRPVDMEFAPDGSLYLADWHNILVGHMQHNARDPLRDHLHGRIYRITYPSKPLVKPAQVAGASIRTLLDNLKLPEYRTRYRSRRELRGKSITEVMPILTAWLKQLDPKDPRYEHHRLEALWVTWGLNQPHATLLQSLMQAKDPNIRHAAVNVLRFNEGKIPNFYPLMMQAAKDTHPRVRMEALVASTWFTQASMAKKIQALVDAQDKDLWLATTSNHIKNPSKDLKNSNVALPKEKNAALLAKGKEIYTRDGSCQTCHQANGLGLEASGFPPLSKSKWVNNSAARLIKLVMHGLTGPMEVNGKKYEGLVPMTPFGGLLSDEEMAAVLTYVRSNFGNNSSPIAPEMVKAVRQETKNRKGFYTAQELLSQHPDE